MKIIDIINIITIFNGFFFSLQQGCVEMAIGRAIHHFVRKTVIALDYLKNTIYSHRYSFGVLI